MAHMIIMLKQIRTGEWVCLDSKRSHSYDANLEIREKAIILEGLLIGKDTACSVRVGTEQAAG